MTRMRKPPEVTVSGPTCQFCGEEMKRRYPFNDPENGPAVWGCTRGCKVACATKDCFGFHDPMMQDFCDLCCDGKGPQKQWTCGWDNGCDEEVGAPQILCEHHFDLACENVMGTAEPVCGACGGSDGNDCGCWR